MDPTEEPSRILRDLITLENDFKYNLKLLKIRELEIERCSSANKALQEMQSGSLAEIDRQNLKIARLETVLNESEERRQRENQICQHNIDNLTQNIVEMKRKHQSQLEDCRVDAARDARERADGLMQMIKGKEIVFQQKEQTLRQKLDAENQQVNQLNHQLKTLAEENTSLRNKVRQLDSRYVSDSEIYKSELKTMQRANQTLESELQLLKENFSEIEKKRNELQEECEKLALRCSEESNKTAALIEDVEQIKSENVGLRREIRERVAQNEELLVKNRQLTSDKIKLAAESQTKCDVPIHSNYEEVVKQNGVLKELVKSMRREREQMAGSAGDFRNAEQRIESLEDLVGMLKNCVDREDTAHLAF